MNKVEDLKRQFAYLRSKQTDARIEYNALTMQFITSSRSLRKRTCCKLARPETGFFIEDGCSRCRLHHLGGKIRLNEETMHKIKREYRFFIILFVIYLSLIFFLQLKSTTKSQ